MTQEEKQLLLKDLCARLPYGVMGAHVLGNAVWSEEPETIVNVDLQEEKIWTDDTVQGYNIEDQDFKPYLRPMSSMTEEEKKEVFACISSKGWAVSAYQEIDYLNSHHFDYRGLIEIGLALEAPEGMYKKD